MCLYVCMYACECFSLSLSLSMCVCVCVCVCVYTYVCVYIYIRILINMHYNICGLLRFFSNGIQCIGSESALSLQTIYNRP